MEGKSRDSDELNTLLINSIEVLTKKIDKVEDLLKDSNNLQSSNNVALNDLKTAVISSNKVFEQVSQGVKDLYEKVRGLEILSKLAGNLNLGSILGGLGSAAGPKK